MKIAVMGAGALGCYFGGRIAASGEDISFIARGAHLEALRSNGLRIESPFGDLHLRHVDATDSPGDVGPVDLVLFLVKLYDTEDAARAMAPLLGPETAVLTFQNGVDAAARIKAIAGAGRVISGIALIPADIRAPGIVRHSGNFARLVFGETDGRDSERCRAFLDILQEAGVEADVVPDITVKVWEKFILLSALSAVTGLTRLSVGPLFANPDSTALFRAAVDETAAVGRAVCPDLGDGAADGAFETLRGMPPNVHASMLDDLERGKRLELRSLSGEVVRLGEKHGIATPTHLVALRALSPYADGAAERGKA